MHRASRVAIVATVLACALPARAHAQTIGQSFTAPSSNTFLESVFTGQLAGPTDGFSYNWILSPLSGSTLVGPTVFNQPLVGPIGPNQTVTINKLLTPGQTYMFYLIAVDPGTLDMTATGSQIAGGSAGTCSLANCTFQSGDVTDFALHYATDRIAATPEPASMTLLGTGLAGLIAARRKRRKLPCA